MAGQLLREYPLQLKISKPRRTKFGDYRFPERKGAPHRISINADLNPYAFLITLLHEWAHLVAFDQYGRSIKPHGKEWQETFRRVSKPFLSTTIFPDDILQAYIKSLNRGVASSCTDLELFKVLHRYDPEKDNSLQLLENLPDGAMFAIGNKVLKKGPRSRKRYRCYDCHSLRAFMVHPLAEVEILNKE